MKPTVIIAICFILSGCGSRKMLRDNRTADITITDTASVQRELNAIIYDKKTITKWQALDWLNIEINPKKEDSTAYFTLDIDGKKIRGTTSGTVKINRNTKHELIRKKHETTNAQKQVENHSQQSKKQIRTTQNHKTTERKEPYSFNIIIAVFFVLSMVFLGLKLRFKR